MRMQRLAAIALVGFALWGCSAQTSEAPASGGLQIGTRFLPPGQVGGMEFSRTPFGDQEVLILGRSLSSTSAGITGTFPPVELPYGGSLNTQIENRVVPLPLKHTDVKAQLTLNIGAVTVTQQYHNPYASKIEAVYVFPLPDDAGVRDFIMQIGE